MTVSAELPVLTECGLPGIRELPYGVHMCHIYRDAAELTATLAAYFATGLKHNERCLWITHEPTAAMHACLALRSAGADVAGAMARDQLRIVRYPELYREGGAMTAEALCARWLAEEESALAAGHNGLRVAGDAAFVGKEDWAAFMDYEQAAERAFQGRRIVALCCYPQRTCGPSELFEVMHRHSCVLDRPDQGWQILIPRAA